ncbi:mRNA (2'-O-methyladenosine-N6-)-methyltransferase [Plasmodium vinckei petteri]|uniref:mRNA (2'-O-methyladenosine-N6-)-methyltransferase n=1 Tax=Plasmodium vinckei petteri TaxID=138298 RepID=W7ANI8_PLAVN|nr:mRNA (2'-O-methyladenosine-N6-)-methyltransferase [Plasmodium vinckei petteri]CAD2096449.1 mRNA (N6-adenosine)-methyltransferase, putative [Plasmodium vinckei petteri]
MSLAREKYLKRKRELLESINIIDSNLEDKKDARSKEKIGENKNDSQKDNKRKHEERQKYYENNRRDYEQNKSIKTSESVGNSSKNYDSLNRIEKHKTKHSTHHDRSENNSYSNANRDDSPLNIRENKYSRNNNLGMKPPSNMNKNDNKLSTPNYRASSNVSDAQLDARYKDPLNDIPNLKNIEIYDSSILLLFTCKILLEMCEMDGGKPTNVKKISITSVEILREIKSRNRKNIKFLKINILNNVLVHMTKNRSSEKHDYGKRGASDVVCEKYKEIKLEGSCIDIENVGINIIIKTVYINNIKKLLLRYLYKFSTTNNSMMNPNFSKNMPRIEKDEMYRLGNNSNEYNINNSNMDAYNNNNMFGQREASYNSLTAENDNNKSFGAQQYLPEQYTNMGREMMHVNNNIVSGNEHIEGGSKINYLENLLNEPTAKEKKIKEETTNILSILEAPTVIEELRIKKFQKKNDSVKIICQHLTKKACQKHNKECDKIHFKKIISEHTDISLGDCSYLDTCRHIETCKFVHYCVDKEDKMIMNEKNEMNKEQISKKKSNYKNTESFYTIKYDDNHTYEPQWIRCDLRNFDLSIFNQYVSVVMADPPWDIHMDLPYGTMTDNEMKHLPVQLIQDEGMIFLWVTGRAMELARECLQIWGYKRVEEILWVKTNHLQRIIRTGRTGHWINHSKEHCLVGIKGNPVINRNIDCNVIVSEVRETSRKPDEIYTLIERMCPQNLKIELFGRPHNVRRNWITLGNQLNGVVLHHPQVKERYNKVAPKFNMPLCE